MERFDGSGRGMVWYGMVKLEPSVATGCVDGSTPMVWYGMVTYFKGVSGWTLGELNFEYNDRRNANWTLNTELKWTLNIMIEEK